MFQLIRTNHEEAEKAHTRLRVDWRDHDERLLKLEAHQAEHTFQIKALQTATPDLSRMTLSPGMVASVVLAIISIVGGQLASTWGMRSDIRDIRTNMENVQKIQEERDRLLRNAVDDVKKKQDLQQLEIQNLRETILQQRTKP